MDTHTQQFNYVHHIHQPVIVFTKAGTIVTCNNAMCSIVSQQQEQLVGNLLSKIFKNAETIIAAIDTVANSTQSVQVDEIALLNSNDSLQGAIARIDENHYCFIGTNNTPPHALLQTVIDAMPRYIIVIDDTGAIVLVNTMWVKFINSMLHTTIDRKDCIKRNFFDFCHELKCFDHALHAQMRETVKNLIVGRIDTASFENAVNIKGEKIWFRFTFSRYVLTDTIYCLLVINDITQQKSYEEQIKRERDTFQKYIDIAPYMIVVLDETGAITLVNQKAIEITGYSHDELIGKNWFDLCVPDEMRNDVRDVFLQLMQGNIAPVEFYENPVKTKDGTLKLIAWHNTILKDEDGTIIGTISSGDDITKQKQMEIELLRSTTNLKAIVKAFPDLYVVADKDGVIYDYQFGEEMKLFATSDQVIGKNFKDTLPKHLAELYQHALDEVLSTNKVVGIEYQIEIGDETRWREARLVPMMKERLLVVIRDVTQRKHAELALAESERRYRHLVNRIPAAVVEMNMNGEIIFVNSYFENLTGYSLKNIHGTHWFRSILHPHEDKRKIRQFVEMIQNGDVNNFEIRIINREGSDTYMSITTSNVYSAVGKLERIVCIAADITPIIFMREQLKELSIKDELTGLYNRRGFLMLAEQQLKVSKRTGKGIALFYIDMDNMKTINDTLGHHEGDKALIDVAGILRLSFRDSDIVARLGGDEFAVLAIDCEKQFVEMMQKRLVWNIEEFNIKGLRQYTISLSIGCVYISDSSLNLDEALNIADTRMYQDKIQRKKNRQ